jgi:hypothetical protein
MRTFGRVRLNGDASRMTVKSDEWHTPDRLPLDHNTTDYIEYEGEIVLSCPNCSNAYLIRDLDYFFREQADGMAFDTSRS